jgi:hypothetical protein
MGNGSNVCTSAQRIFLEAMRRGGRYGLKRDGRWIVIGKIGSVSVREASLAEDEVSPLIARGDLRLRQGVAEQELEVTARGRVRGAALDGGARVDEHDDEVEEAAPVVNPAESPLAWLRSRRGRDGQPLVDEASFLAGERFRADLALSGMLPRVTADWAMTPGGSSWRGGLLPTEVMIAAKQRVDKARTAIGAEFAGVLIDFCGFLKGLESLERERGWPARAAKVVVLLALAALARHYGLQNEAVGRRPAPPVPPLPDNVIRLPQR